MKFGAFFIRRPVLTSMVFLGMLLFGVLAWFQLPQGLFPNISVPQLVIITKYPNAAPEEIENLLTKPLEEAVGTVPNLKRVKSISKEGLSAVMLEFGWGTDMGFAHLSTREKLDRMKDRLPQDAEEHTSELQSLA
jgi:HAE1 family hydrophobic/amphiphilic exporter-1